MEKAKPFEEYFNDTSLAPEVQDRMQLMRQLVHKIYPDVVEKVSYAMPGFYPKGVTKANQQLFLTMANKNWLGLYGTFGLDAEEKYSSLIIELGIECGKGSLHVPYNLPKDQFEKLLKAVIEFNLVRNAR